MGEEGGEPILYILFRKELTGRKINGFYEEYLGKPSQPTGFMRAVVAGLADLDAGREVSLAEAKFRLGLSQADD
ncbi:MAG: hypothetical protein N838_03190 [Thiohalocapsa sp. PB-PSB1]|jgi:hypothetical protein|nr:MAG: hypothetical protein N838_34495 [Thiohalocapsa sp. PB-PSB1]QQO51958.1 MAG: hypothetical protein N838_03190 [Thiohalocapsa sp. PB-PSB1]